MFIKKSKELDFHGLFVTSRVQHPRPNIYNHQQNYKLEASHSQWLLTLKYCELREEYFKMYAILPIEFDHEFYANGWISIKKHNLEQYSSESRLTNIFLNGVKNN